MRQDKILSECLLDGNVQAKQDRRARRQRAMVAALAFEAVLAAWLLLLPILTPGGSPPEIVMMPRVFPGDPADESPPRPTHPPVVRRPDLIRNVVFQKVRSRPRTQISNAAPPPDIPLTGVGNAAPDMPSGLSGATDGLNEGNWSIAPPQPKAPRMIRTSEGVQSAMLIHRVEPLYPAFARTAHISGTVELRAIIGRDGKVSSVEVLGGNPLLARAAMEAVRQWRYRPTILDGEAVEVETRITVNFILGQ